MNKQQHDGIGSILYLLIQKITEIPKILSQNILVIVIFKDFKYSSNINKE